MEQKILSLCFFVIITGMFQKAYSQTIEVESLKSFSTENPPASIDVRLAEPLQLSKSVILDKGVTITGDLIDVVNPKRLKKDARFSFKPKVYQDEEGKTHDITQDITATYTVPLNKGKLAKNAALGVGSFFVKGLSVGVAAIQGAVENEEDNRIKSSAVSAYEATPFSYVRKGEELKINENQTFYLKFPDLDDMQNTRKSNTKITTEKE